MKRFFISIVILCFTVTVFSTDFHTVESRYYRVSSQIGPHHALEIARQLDTHVALFNSLLRFNLEEMPGRMAVRVYSEKEYFDDFLLREGVSQKESFAYLQYSEPSRNVLACFYMDDQSRFDTTLRHHSFLQFFSTFVAYPPRWLQRGLAVYFERSIYDPAANKTVFKPNLGWIDTLKTYTKNNPEGLFLLDEIMKISSQEANDNIQLFYAQSWGIVNFLINSPDAEHNRLFFDSISRMKANVSREENEQLLMNRVFHWAEQTELAADFISFSNSLKTFRELINDGMQYYSLKNYRQSETAFLRALELNASHPVAYYYLGLINYDRKDYKMAEYYYKKSLDFGVDEALVYYALGINAYANSQTRNSREFLVMSSTLSPEGIGEKAEILIARIDDEQKGTQFHHNEIFYDTDDLETLDSEGQPKKDTSKDN